VSKVIWQKVASRRLVTYRGGVRTCPPWALQGKRTSRQCPHPEVRYNKRTRCPSPPKGRSVLFLSSIPFSRFLGPHESALQMVYRSIRSFLVLLGSVCPTHTQTRGQTTERAICAAIGRIYVMRAIGLIMYTFLQEHGHRFHRQCELPSSEAFNTLRSGWSALGRKGMAFLHHWLLANSIPAPPSS